MTIIYCDIKGCAFQENDQCTRLNIQLNHTAVISKFCFSCASYEERNLTSKCSRPDKAQADRDDFHEKVIRDEAEFGV